ncbi:DUF2303 family protein [Thiohalorhabdus sp.]|uniref:DUF2303 family protein n=1 Tax=Thiohalorhabdus sp. TaxID=3094134 RepID=UPI002FC318F2
MSDQGDNLEAVLAAGAATGTAAKVEPDDQYAVVPNNYRLMDLERFHPAPRRTRDKVEMQRLQSLIQYVQDFKDPGTVVYAEYDEDRIEAIIDHPVPDEPRWGDHRANYVCPKSKEWRTWNRHDGIKAGQEDFAQFLEDNQEDIFIPESDKVAPSAADMLEFATTLNAKRNVTFNSSTRLSDGSGQLSFKEEVNDTAGKSGQMVIPGHFYIAIPVYQGGDPYVVKAKVRYRVKDGDLALWYDLHRPEKVHERAFEGMVDQIAAEVECSIYWGIYAGSKD